MEENTSSSHLLIHQVEVYSHHYNCIILKESQLPDNITQHHTCEGNQAVIMGFPLLAVKLMAKYHISIVHKMKAILAVTMEFSTKHLACFTPAVQVGWNQLKPVQSSLVQFSAHDK